MADKKSRKYLSVLQAFSAPTAFVCSNRIRAVSLFHARRVYPLRNPFPHQPRLSAPQAVAFSRFSGKWNSPGSHPGSFIVSSSYKKIPGVWARGFLLFIIRNRELF